MDAIVVITGAALMTGLIAFVGTGTLITGGMAIADRKAKNVSQRTLDQQNKAEGKGKKPPTYTRVHRFNSGRPSEGNRFIRDGQL